MVICIVFIEVNMARLPMYRQIADAIREKISDGEYKVGTALPTEAQLREEFSCSRVTVRQALKLLIENGELERLRIVKIQYLLTQLYAYWHIIAIRLRNWMTCRNAEHDRYCFR